MTSERHPLALPDLASPARAVLDTDTFNEVDDQFALAYSVLSPDRIRLEACYAAPFHNARSSGPEEGMLKSRDEILNILSLLDEDLDGQVFPGSRRYLSSPRRPVESEAARDLVRRAMRGGPEPLYVMAIAAATNIASALIMEPAIRERIVVIWLGGHPHTWPHSREFNLSQDPIAARILFDSGVPLVHFPCKNVTEHLRTSLPELAHCLGGRNALCDYLLSVFKEYTTRKELLSKPLWDIAVPAYLVQPAWTPSELRPAPILTPEETWALAEGRHPVRVVTDVHRDRIFADLFLKLQSLERAAAPSPSLCEARA